MKVRVYFITNATHDFLAKNNRNAREIAKRIIMEGCWIINEDKTEEFYPTAQIFKVKILLTEES